MATSADASTFTVDGAFEAVGEGAVEGAVEGFGRPVLGGSAVALGALTGAVPGRVWALRDEEVAAALGVLGEVVAAARAQLVVVLAEAQRRSLGAGQGWGAVDWARAVAPSLSTRDLLDAHEVATALASAGSRPMAVTTASTSSWMRWRTRPHRPRRTGLRRWGWARRRWCAGSTGPCAAWPTPVCWAR